MMSNAVLNETQGEIAMAAAKKAAEKITPEQLLKLNGTIAELKAMNDELVKAAKNRDRVAKEAASMRDAPEVDAQQIFDTLKDALETWFPGREFLYERTYLADWIARNATYLGRGKKTRKRSILARLKKEQDAGREDMSIDYAPQNEDEAREIEEQGQRPRNQEALSAVNESLVRCKALQTAARVYFERNTNREWVRPPTVEERAEQRRIDQNARSFHPGTAEDIEF
jgi:hypothetical protein